MFKRLMTKEDRAAYRAAIIPKDACKVTSKEADVVFYLYEGHKPCAMCFIGSAGKPAWRYHFRSEAERARRIASQIEACKAREKAMAERKVSASQPCKIEVGSILVTSWGYDQTNREFFKVIDKKGKQTLVVQEVEQVSANTGIKLVQNVEENRLQIIFPGKPDAETRAKLKGSGFRWSPTSGARQRHLGNSAIWAAQSILKELRDNEVPA